MWRSSRNEAFSADVLASSRSPISLVLAPLPNISRDKLSIGADQPVVRTYAHRSGAIIRLRGFLSDSGENRGHFTVLIELGETETLLRQRLSSRYRLRARQAELLMTTVVPDGHRQSRALL